MSTGKVVVVAAVTSIIVTMVTFFGLQRLTAPGKAASVAVPSLIGLRVEQARQVLDAQQLLLIVAERREDPKLAEGLIAAQLPLDGSHVRLGTEVRVIVSAGSPAVQVPALAGLPLASALAQLQARGLQGAVAMRQPSEQLPKDSVISSAPAAGAAVARGALIALTLAEGAPDLRVPRVVALTAGRARELLERAGLKLGRLSHAFDEDQRPGIVLRQEPAVDAVVPRGTAVNLVVNGDE